MDEVKLVAHPIGRSAVLQKETSSGRIRRKEKQNDQDKTGLREITISWSCLSGWGLLFLRSIGQFSQRVLFF
jgi:hypothetical protein